MCVISTDCPKIFVTKFDVHDCNNGLYFIFGDVEPAIRMSILDTVPALLDHHSRLCHSDSENSLETEERLFDVPIRMVSDINQQVCVCVCVHVCV